MTPLRNVIQEHRLMSGLTGFLLLGSILLERITGLHGTTMRALGYMPSYRFFMVFIPFPLVFTFLFIRLRMNGPDGRWMAGVRGWRATWTAYRGRYLRLDRILGALWSGLVVAVVINLFGSWKLQIPRQRYFDWDVRLSGWDQMLHFGRHPWEWLQVVLGHPAVTSGIDWIYYTWLPMVAIVAAWQAWNPRREVRLRFFLVFVLIWIGLGDVLATLLSSAGPCYWDELGLTPNPYAELFAYHARVAETHLFGTGGFQHDLWVRYSGILPTTPYTGISAMPSIHVAMPVLYALAAWQTRRWLGLAFAGYAVLILVGSVHLGWHYAVDGYVSIILVVLLWWLVGRLPECRLHLDYPTLRPHRQTTDIPSPSALSLSRAHVAPHGTRNPC